MEQQPVGIRDQLSKGGDHVTDVLNMLGSLAVALASMQWLAFAVALVLLAGMALLTWYQPRRASNWALLGLQTVNTIYAWSLLP